MQLRVLLPSEVFADEAGVTRILAETDAGTYGILPRRLDCAAALVPGILIYEKGAGEESFIALDEGMLVKTGREVTISVRRAIRGPDLGSLRETVEREFASLDERDRSVRTAMAKLEAHFVRRFMELGRHG